MPGPRFDSSLWLDHWGTFWTDVAIVLCLIIDLTTALGFCLLALSLILVLVTCWNKSDVNSSIHPFIYWHKMWIVRGQG